ncbi:hypothetical protein GGI35DRAFT_488144 [Trichoderma velutinum]
MDLTDSKLKLGGEPVQVNSTNASSRPWTAQSDDKMKVASNTANALDSTQAFFHGLGIQHSGQGHFNVQGNVNITSNPPPDSKEAENCMKALFLTDPSEDRDMLKRKKGSRASGTCEWIFDTDELNAWLHPKETEQESQSSNLLWLHGNPGTGKSTMAIFLTEELPTYFYEKDDMTLAYFFCDASFEKQKTATSIIRGLLYQLVLKHRNLLSKYILPRYKERGDQLFTSFDTLWAVFIAATADQDTGRKYCIIDALDECDNDSNDILLYQLHETFHCQCNVPSNLFILITSRPYPEIREYLQDFINAELVSFDEARQDIDKCIKERVDSLAKKKHYTDKVKREITDLLRDKAEGTFLWVGLACEELREKPSKDAIRFLREMPKGLTSLYKSLLKTAMRGETSERVAIQRILSFVAVSFDALSVLELSEACQLYQDEPDMDTRLQYTLDQIASCRLLVVIHDKKVQLLHQSVRDFVTGSASDFFVETLEAHASAASCCIDNLIKRFHEKNPSEGSLLSYALEYWTEHVREAGEKFKIYKPQIPFFEENSISMMLWMRRKYIRCPPDYTFLHVAVDLGIPILVEYALGMREVHPTMGGLPFNIKQGPNPLHESDESPLYTALWPKKMNQKSQVEIVDMLLKAGAIVTEKEIDIAICRYWTDQEKMLPLFDNMHPETRIRYVQRLLRKDDGDAAENAEQGNKLVEFLLNYHGDQILITEDIMKNAASNAGQGNELVELLLRYQGDQIFITEDIILAAIYNERQDKRIMQLLCQHQSGKITITTKILEAAVVQQQGREFLEILLQHRGDQPAVTITAYMLYSGAVNYRRARESISFVFQKLGNSINNYGQIMVNAIHRFCDSEEFIEFLIHEGGAHIVITDELVEAVLDVNHPRDTYRIACMELFFKHRHKLEFTGEALDTILEYKQNQVSGE